jgi:cholesterol transport system auxiliary component
MIGRSSRLAAIGAAALALCSCVTVFPKAQPEQLYRFGGAQDAGDGPSNAQFSVLAGTLEFDQAASSDKILTVTGDEVAYVKGGRWATSASAMFQEALQRAFDNANGPARLVEHGGAAKIDDELRLDVSRFEARYDKGAGAAPTVVVRVYATLTGYADRRVLGVRTFDAEAPASDNRLGPIASAFDQAADQVLGQIVTWVGQTGAPARPG